MTRKYSLEEFIAKANAVHNNKFCYANTVLGKSKEKIEIICPVHGAFFQTPGHHLEGFGCRFCGYLVTADKKRMSTAEFIEKARAKAEHGDKYDYSKTVYVRPADKVIIICPEHGEFKQSPNAHLSGAGCSKCAKVYSPTTEEFIAKAKAHPRHQGKNYGYEQTIYVRNDEKVKINCPVHGLFLQCPSHHLLGSGCPKCAGKNKSTDDFINHARLIHGDKYDYSEVVYKNTDEKVKIICKEHGVFLSTPDNHLQGCGCRQCSIQKRNDGKRHSAEIFAEAAARVEIHQGKGYLYHLVDYVDTHTNVIIVCPKHGQFEQQPANHLQGMGCQVCALETKADKRRLGAEVFIERSKNHPFHIGRNYDYSLVEYSHHQNKVKIICPEHDVFEQSPIHHMQGMGCPKCAAARQVSRPEQAMFEFIKQYAPDAIQSETETLDGKEIDILIPSLNIGFEFNGLIYHSELYAKDKQYHHHKSVIAMKNGIRLIHIWSDEWEFNREWCESFIKKTLGVKNTVIHARKCEIRHVEIWEVRDFLDRYHNQKTSGHRALAFYFENELVAAATTRRLNDGQVELARWCVKSGITLHAGLKRVAKHLPFDISFCDTAKFDGDGYLKSGMKLLRVSKPSYWYTNGRERRSRVNFQKHKLLSNPKACGNTEKELANSLGWYAIGGLPQLVFGWT